MYDYLSVSLVHSNEFIIKKRSSQLDLHLTIRENHCNTEVVRFFYIRKKDVENLPSPELVL